MRFETMLQNDINEFSCTGLVAYLVVYLVQSGEKLKLYIYYYRSYYLFFKRLQTLLLFVILLWL